MSYFDVFKLIYASSHKLCKQNASSKLNEMHITLGGFKKDLTFTHLNTDKY